MPILNFRIRKLSGERIDEEARTVEVKANSTIASLKIQNDPRIGNYLLVNFKYEVEYEPNLGNISMEGSLWYRHPEFEKMVKDKGDKIELKDDAIREISTAIIQDSLLESVDLARKLMLPPPLQLPKVNVKPKQITFKKVD